jgi:hypothetical protein
MVIQAAQRSLYKERAVAHICDSTFSPMFTLAKPSLFYTSNNSNSADRTLSGVTNSLHSRKLFQLLRHLLLPHLTTSDGTKHTCHICVFARFVSTFMPEQIHTKQLEYLPYMYISLR